MANLFIINIRFVLVFCFENGYLHFCYVSLCELMYVCVGVTVCVWLVLEQIQRKFFCILLTILLFFVSFFSWNYYDNWIESLLLLCVEIIN